MKKLVALALLTGFTLSIAACASGLTKGTDGGQATTKAQKEQDIDYDKQGDWELSVGKMQSPINISAGNIKKMIPDTGNIRLNYGTAVKKAENNGHSIQVSDSGDAVINGRNFKLTQFHFHAQSEHTVDGKHYPLEAHFVNTAQDGRVAVIAVFFDEGRANKGFQEVLDDVDSGLTKPITDLDEMIPENKSYYHYLGSLTTPPLNENVEWYVMKSPVHVSNGQIESFKRLYSHNNRDVQPLNGRIILEHDE